MLEKIRNNKFCQFIWPYLLIALATTIVISPQLISHTILASDDTADTLFHYSRFYDAGMQIKTGIFSIFQTNFTFQQSGRIINAIYGPLFAYFNGILVLVAGNWFNYQIILTYLISLLGAGSMYYLLKKVGINKLLATVIGIIYINIGMIPAFINRSSFNGWGQALMPLVVLCGVRMIQDKRQPINWIQLMLVMGLLVQVHVLSTLMAALLLIPFFVCSLIINKNSKKVWIPFTKAVVGTVVLSANVIGAFLVLMPNNHLAANTEFDLSRGGLRPHMLWHNEYGTAFAYILPIFVLLIIAQFVYAIMHYKRDKLNAFVTVWGTILLGLSSFVFPWGLVQRVFPSLKSYFQFPFRLTVVAYPLILLGMGLTVNYLLKQGVKPRVVGISLVTILLLEAAIPNLITNHIFTVACAKDTTVQQVADKSNDSEMLNMLKWHYLPDYLPTKDKSIDQNAAYLYKINVVNQWQKYRHYVTKNGDLILSWKGKESRDIILPVVLYKQSELTVNNKKFSGAKNVIGNPIIYQKRGLNHATLRFIVPTWFYIVSAISMMSWLAAIVFLIWKNFINGKNN